MSRFRLRYGSTDLELAPGEFVVGRSAQCNLALDDTLVSRRHAAFNVSNARVELQDLGSRNGIAVNGQPVSGKQVLKHMDRVQIGNQELLLLAQNEQDSAATLQMMVCSSCSHLNDSLSEFCTKCGHSLTQSTTLVGIRQSRGSFEESGDESEAEETTAVGSSFHLLKTIATKALAMGRYDEAELILGPSLQRVRDRASEQNYLFEKTRRDAVELVVRLMEGPEAERWLVWLFELHADIGVVLEKETIATLHSRVRKMKTPKPRSLETYLSALGTSQRSPSEVFRIKQLQGLLRVIRA